MAGTIPGSSLGTAMTECCLRAGVRARKMMSGSSGNPGSNTEQAPSPPDQVRGRLFETRGFAALLKVRAR
jgi:hypothetical protein